MLHGNRTYLLMDDDGQIEEAHSISAGLDYPGIGPEHAWLADLGRVKFLPRPTRRRSPRSSFAAGSKASSRRWSRATRWPSSARSRRKAEGPPDGGQSLGPRRQGPRQRREAPRGQAVMRALRLVERMPRQGRTGWTLVIFGIGYILDFF